MELATVVDVGEHFVKATYKLESDGPLVLRCYEEILKIQDFEDPKHVHNCPLTCSRFTFTAAMARLWHELCTVWYSVLSGEVW